eukprot:Nitzschia sp. Nitz4//scaffold28_size193895//18236//19166//NITZ4_001623-RA/size193895-processed-gene-0.247-mRNA-1//-1//CDS//3329545856//5295//frame0
MVYFSDTFRELYRDVYRETSYNGTDSYYYDALNSSTTIDPTTRGFERSGVAHLDIMTILLIAFFSLFCLAVTVLRLPCFGNLDESFQALNNPSMRKRSSKQIKDLVVLKHILAAPGNDEEVAKQSADFIDVTRHRLKKSDLFLRPGAVGEVDSARTTCPICLCNYEEGDEICWSNNKECTHYFHLECGIDWLSKHCDCPVCRAPYLVIKKNVKPKQNQHANESHQPEEEGEEPPTSTVDIESGGTLSSQNSNVADA